MGGTMKKRWRALLSGAAGTLAMTTVFLVIDVETRARLLLFEALARFFGVPERVGLGFLVFVVFGVVVWPLLFATLEPRLPPQGDAAVSGMLFATVLWVGFVLIGTSEIVVLLFPFYAAVTLVVHLVYGFTMGLVYGWHALASRPEGSAVGRRVDSGE